MKRITDVSIGGLHGYGDVNVYKHLGLLRAWCNQIGIDSHQQPKVIRGDTKTNNGYGDDRK